MARYRKKPVVIEAWRHTEPAPEAKPQWLTDAINAGNVYYQGGETPYYTVRTLEGDMRAELGDFIIRGVKGELYPCKPVIFAATYESVP